MPEYCSYDTTGCFPASTIIFCPIFLSYFRSSASVFDLPFLFFISRSRSTCCFHFNFCRFVSLIPFQRRPSVGEQTAQSWNSPHAFLAAGRGDASDHALLLCSLLLGFGLDAFVCIGLVHPSGADGTEAEFVKHGGADIGGGPGEADETGHMVSAGFTSGRGGGVRRFLHGALGLRCW